MSWKASAWAARNRVGNPTRKLVLLALAENANADGYSPVGYAYLADVAECSPKSVQRALEALESMGLLVRRRRRKPDGNLGGYDMWLQLHQEQFAFDPSPACPGSESEQSPDNLTTGQNDHWTPTSGLSDHPQGTESPQGVVTESTPSPVYPRSESPVGTRAPAREAAGGSMDWNGWTLNLRHAPDSLTPEAFTEWLNWKVDRDPRWRPSPMVVDQVLRELAKADAKGWTADEALSVWMQAGWSSFRADYLDRMAPAAEASAAPVNGGGMSGTAQRTAERLRRSEAERQRRQGNG